MIESVNIHSLEIKDDQYCLLSNESKVCYITAVKS